MGRNSLQRTLKDPKQLVLQAEHMRKMRAERKASGQPNQASAWSQLSPRHKVFLYHYLQTWNGTEAAIRAGYGKASAHTEASRLLKHAKVAAAIKERFQEMHMGADAVLARVAEIANANVLKYIDANGKLDFEGLKRVGYLVREFDIEKGGKTHVRLHDQLAALIALGKHHNLFVERQEVTGASGGPITHAITLTPEQAAAVAPKQKQVQ